MLKSRVLTGALVTGAFVVASMFAAAPASAATLPAGQKISVVNYDTWEFSYANPDTAALTPVGGSDANEDEYITAVDVDNTGLGFAFSTTYESIPGEPDPQNPEEPVFPTYEPIGGALFKADANTGLLTDGMKMSILFDDEVEYAADECTAIDYSNGQVLGVCYNYDESPLGFVGIVDTENAVLNAETMLVGDTFVYFTSIAVSPIDGTIWGFEQFKGDGYAWIIAPDGSLGSFEGQLDLIAVGADFDSGGQLWITAYNPDIPALIGPGGEGLATLDLTTLDNPFSAQWPDPAYYSEAITVWGAALPATGPSESAGVVVGAAGFLLLGAILAVGATARRRATES